MEQKIKKVDELQATAAAVTLKEAGVHATPEDQDLETSVPKHSEPPVGAQAIEESMESGVAQGPNKCSRGEEDVIRTYVPKWGMLMTDHICYGVLEESKEVAPDLCRGLMLPADQSLYSAATSAEAIILS